LTVSAGPGLTLENTILPQGSTFWHPTGLDLPGDPVVTSCGTWNLSLSLDGTYPQPVSPLVLQPAAEDSTHGVLATVLQVKAHLHLVNPSTGQAFDDSLRLGFGLAGPWSLAAGDSSDPAMGSDLVFPTGPCGKVWILESSPFSHQFVPVSDGCDFCWQTVAPNCSGGACP
jgi:hypothetical protein